MRILFASSELGFGGGERILLDLMNAALRAGHHVVMCCPSASVLAGTTTIEQTSDLGAAARDADLVIANDFASVMRLGVIPHTRIAFVCHGAWQTSVKMNAWLRAVRASVWCVSTQVLAACVRHWSLGLDRVHLLPYGPDLECLPRAPGRRALARARLGLSEDAFVAANVSRFHPVKRLPEFVEAVTRPGWFGALAVSDSFSTADEARALLDFEAAVEARPNIVFRRNEPPDDIYDAADVLVSTSLSESLGVSLLEGMARGLPVVCTAVGGVQDFLLHQRNGFWLPGAGVDDVAAALGVLAADAGLRTRMATSAREAVEGRSPAIALEQVLSVRI